MSAVPGSVACAGSDVSASMWDSAALSEAGWADRL